METSNLVFQIWSSYCMIDEEEIIIYIDSLSIMYVQAPKSIP